MKYAEEYEESFEAAVVAIMDDWSNLTIESNKLYRRHEIKQADVTQALKDEATKRLTELMHG